MAMATSIILILTTLATQSSDGGRTDICAHFKGLQPWSRVRSYLLVSCLRGGGNTGRELDDNDAAVPAIISHRSAEGGDVQDGVPGQWMPLSDDEFDLTTTHLAVPVSASAGRGGRQERAQGADSIPGRNKLARDRIPVSGRERNCTRDGTPPVYHKDAPPYAASAFDGSISSLLAHLASDAEGARRGVTRGGSVDNSGPGDDVGVKGAVHGADREALYDKGQVLADGESSAAEGGPCMLGQRAGGSNQDGRCEETGEIGTSTSWARSRSHGQTSKEPLGEFGGRGGVGVGVGVSNGEQEDGCATGVAEQQPPLPPPPPPAAAAASSLAPGQPGLGGSGGGGDGRHGGWIPDFDGLDLEIPDFDGLHLPEALEFEAMVAQGSSPESTATTLIGRAPPLPRERRTTTSAPSPTAALTALALPPPERATGGASQGPQWGAPKGVRRGGGVVLTNQDGAVLPKDMLGRYPAWLPAGAAEQQQMVDTNPLAMSLLPPSHPCQSSTIAVYNPIYGQDNVSYAVTIPPKLLLTKFERNKYVRTGGGEIWRDKQLEEWPLNDTRLFIGDLGQHATDQALTGALREWKGFNMARVVTNRATKRCKGYGFASFARRDDALALIRHQRAADRQGAPDAVAVGGRPVVIKLSKLDSKTLTADKMPQVRCLQHLKQMILSGEALQDGTGKVRKRLRIGGIPISNRMKRQAKRALLAAEERQDHVEEQRARTDARRQTWRGSPAPLQAPPQPHLHLPKALQPHPPRALPAAPRR